VTLEEAEMVVNEIGKERKSIARSMKDVDFAIRKLDNVLVAFVLVIAIFIMVSFLNSSLETTLATAGTALLSLSFIFASTCQEVLASILFLFYKVPLPSTESNRSIPLTLATG
jgi:small-conductance mechanosensitive channel